MLASSTDGSEGAAVILASEVGDEPSSTRRGRKAALITGLDIKRATGCPWPV